MSNAISGVKKLLTQSSHYLTGTVLLTFSSFITFPIFTRIFSVADYGLMSLITVIISTVLAISKFGLSTASLRMYEDSVSGHGPFTSEQYYSTFTISSFFTGAGAVILCIIITLLLSDSIISADSMNLLFFSYAIIFIKTVYSVMMSFFIAEQGSKTYNIINIISNYAASAASIILTLYLIKGVFGFYAGQFIIMLMTTSYLLWVFSKKHTIRLGGFSKNLLLQSMAFGLPLVGLEFFNHVLTFGDRFFIKKFCDPNALGIYSVGYNLSYYLSNIMLVPISSVIIPLLSKIWVRDGEEATKSFLTTAVRYLSMIIFPAIAGYIAVSDELIQILASPKYKESVRIIPYVTIGMMFLTFSYILNAGLIINKRTDKILINSGFAAILNLILNFVLIPVYGIFGAAISTLITYALLCLCITISSFKYMSFPIPLKLIVLYLVLSLMMYFSISMIFIVNLMITLCIKIALGIMLYWGLVLIFDGDLRSKCLVVVRTRKRRS